MLKLPDIKAVFIKNSLRKNEMISVRFLAVIGKFCSMALALATSLLIVYRLSPELQGYYYTFAAFGALHAFFDLGLGIIIVSHCSQEWAILGSRDGRLTYVNKSQLLKLGGLIRFFMRWYAISSVVLALSFIVLGIIFFGHKNANTDINWLYPWVALSIGSGIGLYLISILTILEGCNQLMWVYGLRLFYIFISNFIIWVLLLWGYELWSIGISLIISSLIVFLIIYLKFKHFFREFFNVKRVKISWKEEIFPMQWRLSLSWISGYLAFSLFVPVLFKFKGPVIAGQMGFSWNFIGAITAFTSVILAVKTPGLGIEIAHKNVEKIKQIMRSLILESIIISVGMGVVVISILTFVDLVGWSIGSRILPMGVFIYFIGAAILICLSFPFSIYMRAHKEEPGIWVSLVQGVLVATTILIIGRFYSLELLAQMYFLIMLCSLPFIIYIYLKKKKYWYDK
jgi:hypothetical protein